MSLACRTRLVDRMLVERFVSSCRGSCLSPHKGIPIRSRLGNSRPSTAASTWSGSPLGWQRLPGAGLQCRAHQGLSESTTNRRNSARGTRLASRASVESNVRRPTRHNLAAASVTGWEVAYPHYELAEHFSRASASARREPAEAAKDLRVAAGRLVLAGVRSTTPGRASLLDCAADLERLADRIESGGVWQHEYLEEAFSAARAAVANAQYLQLEEA